MPPRRSSSRRTRSRGLADWRTSPGELLWPAVVDQEEHDRRALNLGSHKAAGQLQQRPSAREGAILKRAAWRFFPSSWLEDGELHYLPAFTGLVQSWDTAFKDRTSSDFVVGGLWGQRGSDLYLLALARDRMGLSATKQAMRAMTALAETRWPRLPMRILIEKSANGVEIIEELKREIRGVTPVTASVSKVARAEAAEPAMEAGNVFLPGMSAPESPSGYNEAMDTGVRAVAGGGVRGLPERPARRPGRHVPRRSYELHAGLLVAGRVGVGSVGGQGPGDGRVLAGASSWDRVGPQ